MGVIYRAKFDGEGFLAGMYPDDVWPLMVPDESKPIINSVPEPGWVPPEDDPDAEAPTVSIQEGYEMIENPRLPEGLIVVTDQQYQDLLSFPGRRRWADGTLTVFEPPALVVVPQSISDRQFFQQLAIDGIITEAEALAAVQTGTIPAALLAIVDLMPADQQFSARMIITGATTFERGNALTVAIGQKYGMAPDQIDDFFVAAAQL